MNEIKRFMFFLNRLLMFFVSFSVLIHAFIANMKKINAMTKAEKFETEGGSLLVRSDVSTPLDGFESLLGSQECFEEINDDYQKPGT